MPAAFGLLSHWRVRPEAHFSAESAREASAFSEHYVKSYNSAYSEVRAIAVLHLSGKYLSGYTQRYGSRVFRDFTEAMHACIADPGAGGITRSWEGTFTVRQGSKPLPSPAGEISWLKPEEGDFSWQLDADLDRIARETATADWRA